jgi:hypothetical protein
MPILDQGECIKDSTFMWYKAYNIEVGGQLRLLLGVARASYC